MDRRHKDFNKYLSDVEIMSAITECIARLFMLNDSDRPDHGIWFIQNCMDTDMDQDFIVKYDNLLFELSENNRIIKNHERAKEKAKLLEKQAADAAKKKEEEEKKAAEVAAATANQNPSAISEP